MSGGKPPYFNSPEELQEKIEVYFDDKCVIDVTTKAGVSQIKRPTITGLCYFLGFESRQSFYDYEGRAEYSYTVRRARLRIEQFYEQGLSSTTPTGSIFALKNFGWNDKIEIDPDSITIESKLTHKLDDETIAAIANCYRKD